MQNYITHTQYYARMGMRKTLVTTIKRPRETSTGKVVTPPRRPRILPVLDIPVIHAHFRPPPHTAICSSVPSSPVLHPRSPALSACRDRTRYSHVALAIPAHLWSARMLRPYATPTIHTPSKKLCMPRSPTALRMSRLPSVPACSPHIVTTALDIRRLPLPTSYLLIPSYPHKLFGESRSFFTLS